MPGSFYFFRTPEEFDTRVPLVISVDFPLDNAPYPNHLSFLCIIDINFTSKTLMWMIKVRGSQL